MHKLFLLGGVFFLLGICYLTTTRLVPVIKLHKPKSVYSKTSSVEKIGEQSRLPLPRFASLKTDLTNVRLGPGFTYPIVWYFKKQGLPVEIIEEYDNWRKIKDFSGSQGWVYQSLLSSHRYAVVRPYEKENAKKIFNLYETPSFESKIIARVLPGALGRLGLCQNDWCHIFFDQTSGWILQNELWGVYPEEK